MAKRSAVCMAGEGAAAINDRMADAKRKIFSSFFVDGTVSPDEIDRYKIVDIVGKGAYGTVCKAIDTKCGNTLVAIKRIEVINTEVGRLFREMLIHRALSSVHEDLNITKLIRFVQPPPSPHMESMYAYLVMEYMPTSLDQVLKRNITDDTRKLFLFQLLRSIEAIHACGILHRDIKPSNILVDDESWRLVLCDFGLARMMSNSVDTYKWSNYIVTRYYRAPEVIGKQRGGYTRAMDMWSVGCVFAEMLIGHTLFRGRNSKHQMEVIADVIGKPSDEEISMLSSKPMRDILQKLPDDCVEGKLTAILGARAPCEMGLDLLRSMLRFDPRKRITATEALSHPYFSGVSSVYSRPVISALTSSIIRSNAAYSYDPKIDAMDVSAICAQIINELRMPSPALSETSTTTTTLNAN